MKTYNKEQIMSWLGSKVLNMPRPDTDMLKEESNKIGKIEGKYEIYDMAKKEL